jgi:hypothetical protein
MANIEAYEPTWRKCDDCDLPYFIGVVLSPRNHKWSPIPLSLVPTNDVPGNFQIDWRQEYKEVFDADGDSIGHHPVVVYGVGHYRPHNPSHFLEPIHVDDTQREWRPKQRLGNFKLAMDDDDA